MCAMEAALMATSARGLAHEKGLNNLWEPCSINIRTEKACGVETQNGPGGIEPPSLGKPGGPRDLRAMRRLPKIAG